MKERIEAELRAHCASMLDLVTKKLLVGAEADSLKKVSSAPSHWPPELSCECMAATSHSVSCTCARRRVLCSSSRWPVTTIGT